jgi:hypothetical protein
VHIGRGGANQAVVDPGLSIAKNEYVDKFEIHTWGVELLAVCHLPTPGWRLTVGSDGTPNGILSGEGGIVGAAGLNQSGLELLEGLFLIHVIEYQELPRYIPNESSFRRRILNSEYHPATFAGSVHVGKYGRDSKGRKIPFLPSNFVRAPAARCPDPPEPEE